MVLGAVRPRVADVALVVGAIVYGSYGIARGVSLLLHGWPSESLIAAMAIELGIAGSLLYLRFPLRLGGRYAGRPGGAHL